MATLKNVTVSVPNATPRLFTGHAESDQVLQHLADQVLDPTLQAIMQLQAQIAVLQKASK